MPGIALLIQRPLKYIHSSARTRYADVYSRNRGFLLWISILSHRRQPGKGSGRGGVEGGKERGGSGSRNDPVQRGTAGKKRGFTVTGGQRDEDKRREPTEAERRETGGKKSGKRRREREREGMNGEKWEEGEERNDCARVCVRTRDALHGYRERTECADRDGGMNREPERGEHARRGGRRGGVHKLERKGWTEERESSEMTMRATENRTGSRVNDSGYESVHSR